MLLDDYHVATPKKSPRKAHVSKFEVHHDAILKFRDMVIRNM